MSGAYDASNIDRCQSVDNNGRMISLPIVESRTAPTPCCAPLVREPLSAEAANELARRVKALADPTRLRLLSLVAANGGEVCMCDLIAPVGVSQPTVSHHLKVLVEGGLLERDKRGVWAYYSLVPGALDSLAAVLSTAPEARSRVSGSASAMTAAQAT